MIPFNIFVFMLVLFPAFAIGIYGLRLFFRVRRERSVGLFRIEFFALMMSVFGVMVIFGVLAIVVRLMELS